LSEIRWIRDIAAFTEALGVQNAPLIMALSLVPWNDDAQRDQFISDFSNVSYKEELSYGN
jgi:hypothetical protein